MVFDYIFQKDNTPPIRSFDTRGYMTITFSDIETCPHNGDVIITEKITTTPPPPPPAHNFPPPSLPPPPPPPPPPPTNLYPSHCNCQTNPSNIFNPCTFACNAHYKSERRQHIGK